MKSVQIQNDILALEERLKIYFIESGMTQLEFLEKSGAKSQSWLSKWLHGKPARADQIIKMGRNIGI